MRDKGGPGVLAALGGFEPTTEQWHAIRHPLEPLYLIAGAGSGKTAIMAARMVWAVEECGYEVSQLLGLSFSNKAAGELSRRIVNALEALDGEALVPIEPMVQTYHAFAAAIVRDHGLLVGIESEAALLTETQQWQLVLSCLDDLPAFDALELRSTAGVVRATLGLAGSLADHVVSPADVEAAADAVMSSSAGYSDDVVENAAKRRELCLVVAAYQKAKSRYARIDFGDQITKAVEILEGHPAVRDLYRSRWPVVLLDEYQDTNVAQRRLMQALVTPGGAVTAVGDTRQAIYAFRGATMYNLIGFPNHFPRAVGATYPEASLSQNFRSGKNILEVANAVVAPIPAERRPGEPLRPSDFNGAGRVELGLFGEERAEADWIAQRCDELHDLALMPDRRPVEWRDMAVLVRRRSAMAALLKGLQDHDIPVEVVGLSGLLKAPEVMEVVAWLRCLDTKPSANRWLARVLLGPRWRIHYRDLALCARWAAWQNRSLRLELAGGNEERARDMEPGDVGFSLLEALEHVSSIEGLGAEARNRLEEFTWRLRLLRQKVGARLPDLVQEVISVCGIADALAASPARGATAGRQNLANLLDHVAEFAPVEGEASLRSLLAYLDVAEEADETFESSQPAAADSVKLMTVHAAKGLEFECVFVPSVASSTNHKGDYVYSVFPDTRGSNPMTSYSQLPYEVREDAGHLPAFDGNSSRFAQAVKERAAEDERRLFYVATTRAKQHLAVTAAWWYGRSDRLVGPSRFWADLAELERTGAVEVVERAEASEANPAIAALSEEISWPPAPRAGADDPLFEGGLGAAAEAALASKDAYDGLVAALSEEERERHEQLRAKHLSALELIADAVASKQSHGGDPVPDIISATDHVSLTAARLDLAELSRPLPERPSDARAIGTEVHRVIEQVLREAHGQEAQVPSLPDESELDEPLGVEDRDEVERRLEFFRALGYTERTLARLPSGELMIELPFALRIGSRIVRGRIDAVFEDGAGAFELVDFKTGARFESEDEDQLGLYAAALEANGLVPPRAPVTLTYAFLDGGAPVSRPFRS
ncbi:MAG TPA: ATP-dependent DNA helicase [Actinomycetota bacterium]|nr:ATP-dependent DNA helicase [Actinomycetota bacterium]